MCVLHRDDSREVAKLLRFLVATIYTWMLFIHYLYTHSLPQFHSIFVSIDVIIKADVIRTVPIPLYSSASSTLSSATSSSSIASLPSSGAYVTVGSVGSQHYRNNGLSLSSSSPSALTALAAAAKPLSVTGSLLQEKSNLPNDFYIGPYLDGNEMTNITVQKGTNAYLPCKVFIYVMTIVTILAFIAVFITMAAMA